ncbi:MAG TPA: hypothetical protein EYP16_00480, partial [Candidatus Atribacteria bacterium]|nr:hypothetical protein [Candidatus Atribacteria bacterium]
DKGIVKIEVIGEEKDFGSLEILLSKKYSLKEVIISPIHNDIKTSLAMKSIEYIKRVLRENMIISFSWGSTLRKIVDLIELPKSYNKIEVVPVMGGMGKIGNKITSSEIARTFAEKIGGIYYVIHAPVIVKYKSIKEALLKEDIIAEIFTKAKQSNISFVGIGQLSKNSTMVKEGYLSKNDFHILKNEGIIGDICTTFFDKDGKVIHTEIDERIIGVSIGDLKKHSLVVGIAGGKEKKDAIVAVLKGKFIDVLITDEETAIFLKNN